jgi:hypothetical protein
MKKSLLATMVMILMTAGNAFATIVEVPKDQVGKYTAAFETAISQKCISALNDARIWIYEVSGVGVDDSSTSPLISFSFKHDRYKLFVSTTSDYKQ